MFLFLNQTHLLVGEDKELGCDAPVRRAWTSIVILRDSSDEEPSPWITDKIKSPTLQLLTDDPAWLILGFRIEINLGHALIFPQGRQIHWRNYIHNSNGVSAGGVVFETCQRCQSPHRKARHESKWRI